MIDYIVYFQNYKRETKTGVSKVTLITILSRSTNDAGYFLILDRTGIIKKQLTKRLVKELVEKYKLDVFFSIGLFNVVEDIHEELFDESGNKENLLRELENPDFEILKYYEL